MASCLWLLCCFFFNDTATTEIYTLSLHDALPIYCEPRVASRAREGGWGYFDAVRHGVFCELGRGNVDFAAVAAWLRDHRYAGWIVVEQDILPGMGEPRASAQRNREYLASLGL